jgi:hypothetical protein
MGVIDREVIGQPLALGDPEYLRAGKADHPARAGGLGRQQDIPGAQHVHRHDLLRAAGAVVGQRGQVHDRRAAPGRAAEGSQVQHIGAVGQVETGHLVPAAGQEARDPAAHGTAIPGDQNTHPAIIAPDGTPVQPASRPPDFGLCRAAGDAAGIPG